jgi:hypothetical protein
LLHAAARDEFFVNIREETLCGKAPWVPKFTLNYKKSLQLWHEDVDLYKPT